MCVRTGLFFRVTTRSCLQLLAPPTKVLGLSVQATGLSMVHEHLAPQSLVAETTGMYVQMGSFPREHQGAPLPRLGACFGKNRCRDHGLPSCPVGTGVRSQATGLSMVHEHLAPRSLGAETTGLCILNSHPHPPLRRSPFPCLGKAGNLHRRLGALWGCMCKWVCFLGSTSHIRPLGAQTTESVPTMSECKQKGFSLGW